MLQNRLYRGEIVHKEAAYAGQHAMIIEADLWYISPNTAVFSG